MLSMPPATTTSAEPARKRSWAIMAAFMPEPHILLIVVAPAARGNPAPMAAPSMPRPLFFLTGGAPAAGANPAPMAACRAGACPCPAGKTQPIRISSTLSAAIPARSTAAKIARAPSAGALTSFKSPRKPPIGVRAAPTMTMGSVVVMGSALCLRRSGLRDLVFGDGLARDAAGTHIGDTRAIRNAGRGCARKQHARSDAGHPGKEDIRTARTEGWRSGASGPPVAARRSQGLRQARVVAEGHRAERRLKAMVRP